MAKWQNDAMLDTALDYISTNSTELYVCSSQPIDRAAAITAALTGAATPSFQANANGDVSGRKLEVDAATGISITASGDATHIVLCSGTLLLYVTTSTTQTVGSGGTIDVPAWNIEVRDAT